ncbi:Cytochrome oxidase biogenesis protein Surf1, facilitates heme A insertion [Hyphomicrobium sulfonivorans]|uniref:SURF1-like protein n=1 Tax=Hyphomicrobium sulfonivorans TaxID=121290 RepID=A0A120CUS8_HYPSL|nr:SURF1 family protein [Hyphomicrobium sulfonivorans]KWT66720.1 Cytochrome oxidase biogenesis protein Surf1, facilitates heme A insertion [Hyphomicrobium sulfonivorans]
MIATIRNRGLLWPTIATLAGLALLISLGNWQMRRLAWKQHLTENITERVHRDPLPLEAVDAAAARGDDIEYTRVAAQGQWLHDREMHLYALDASHGPGFYIITPLKLADGNVLLVNRGFVPNELKETAQRAEGLVAGDVRVVGLVRGPEAHGAFVPPNELKRNIWYWRDIAAMGAEAAGGADGGTAHVHAFFVDAEKDPVPPGGWPIGGTTRLELPNRHLEYALTWYGLAATLVGVFAAFAVARWRRKGTDAGT